MPIFGFRDMFLAYTCPQCGSNNTVRTSRQKDGTRNIHCKKCLYDGPIRKTIDVRDAFQSDEAGHNPDTDEE